MNPSTFSPSAWLHMNLIARTKKPERNLIIAELESKLPENCPILGIKLNYTGPRGPFSGRATVAKIDPSNGLVPGNVFVVSCKADRVRRGATAAQHRLVADWIEGRLRVEEGS